MHIRPSPHITGDGELNASRVVVLQVLKEDKKLPEVSVLNFARDIVTGLHYVHSQGYLYCDLKPSNLLLLEGIKKNIENNREKNLPVSIP